MVSSAPVRGPPVAARHAVVAPAPAALLLSIPSANPLHATDSELQTPAPHKCGKQQNHLWTWDEEFLL